MQHAGKRVLLGVAQAAPHGGVLIRQRTGYFKKRKGKRKEEEGKRNKWGQLKHDAIGWKLVEVFCLGFHIYLNIKDFGRMAVFFGCDITLSQYQENVNYAEQEIVVGEVQQTNFVQKCSVKQHTNIIMKMYYY